MNSNARKGVCIYGGTFNMPHVGHKASLDWLRGQGYEVVVVPSIAHEYKPESLATYVHRAEMSRLAFGDKSVMEVERDVMRFRPLPINTIDVLDLLREMIGENGLGEAGDPLSFAIGPDVNVARWTGYSQIAAKEYLAVRLPETPGVRSSLIRDSISLGQSWEHLVDPTVAKYIKLHKLYGSRR